MEDERIGSNRTFRFGRPVQATRSTVYKFEENCWHRQLDPICAWSEILIMSIHNFQKTKIEVSKALLTLFINY